MTPDTIIILGMVFIMGLGAGLPMLHYMVRRGV